MKDDRRWRERITWLCIGAVAVIGLLMVTGAADNSAPPNYGRYQMSAWAGSFGPNAGGVGAFVVDTVSGETKAVYTRIYGDPGKSDLLKNDLRKPFSAIP